MVEGRLRIIVFLKVGSALSKRPSIVEVILALTAALILAAALRVITHLIYLFCTEECLSQQSRPDS